MGEAIVEVGRLAGLCGYDGSLWVKLESDSAGKLVVIPADGERLFGFSAIVEEALSDTNLGAGTNVLNGTAVPAGEVHVITRVAVWYEGTVPTSIQTQVIGLATALGLHVQLSPVNGFPYYFGVNVMLQVGDYMQGRVVGATAGDNFYLRYAGYKMASP